MDENYCNKQTFASIVKTILLFLENNNLKETAYAFNNEIEKKLMDIKMSDVAPRTVILRPMDIKTTVDATISDENLIICISGKNIDVTSAGFDQKRVKLSHIDRSASNIPINLHLPIQPNLQNTEVLQNTKKLLNNEEDQILDQDENINKDEEDQQDPINNIAKGTNSTEDIGATTVPGELQNVMDETVENDIQDSTDPHDNTLASSNASTKEYYNNEVTPIESKFVGHYNPMTEEMNQIDATSKTNTTNQAVNDILEYSSTIQSIGADRPRPKTLSPKKYQTKSASPTRKLSQISPNKSSISKPTSSVSRPPFKVYPEINNEQTGKVNRNGAISPKGSIKSQISSNTSQKSKSAVKTQPLSKPVDIEEQNMVKNVSMAEKLSNDNDLQKSSIVPNQLESEIHTGSLSKEDGNLPLSVKPHPFCHLDYVKIKQDLYNGNVYSKLKILQALRWRLTRVDTKVRDHNLVCFITHDLLDISAGSNFFTKYFNQSNDYDTSMLQEEASRFLNTLASMSMGREYLEKCPNLIQILLPILMKSSNQSVNFNNLTRQFVMASVQKLSLGGRIRKMLINEGIVEWLIKYILSNHNQMTDYEAEYSVALFSNLCIHKTMRELCEIMADETAQLLNALVFTPHKCCLPYLSGILGSLLTNDAINKRATELNIQKKLKYLAECSEDEETRLQLEFIIQLHESSAQNKCMYDVVEEPQIYSDYLECELGMNEADYKEPVGEQFLENYCSSYPNLEKHIHVVKRSCSFGVNKCQTDCWEAEHPIKVPSTNLDVVSHSAANKRTTKVEIFKDMFNQVPSSPSPPITTPCRLNYYNLNRPISIPVRYSSTAKSKYSCECYEEIKNVLGEDTKNPRNLLNSGRKPNNVVYGPLISPKNYCSTINVFPCGVKQCCG